MSKKIKVNYGNCYQCGKTFSSAEIKNHILNEHNNGDEESFLIQVESADFYDYWLYIDIPKSKKIEYIDKFLRNIWLECCGHISRFAASYNSQNNIGKSRAVGSFKAGDKIYYEYDMGTTTALFINFIGEIKRPKQTNSVRLLARNEAPELNCTICGSPANFICTECMYNPDESVGSLFCEKHSEQHEHDDMMMPITNSPRSGECGYTGEYDFYGFTGELKRDQETSVGKIRRYGWFKAEDKTKNTGGFEIVKSNNIKSMDIESLIDRFLSENYDEPDITGDTGEVLLEMFTEFADNLVIKSRPLFTLKEFFSTISLSELKDVAQTTELKNYSKLKKSELIDFIIKKLTKTEILENVLAILSEEEFELFNDLLEKDYIITDKNIFSNILILCSYVFLLFYFEGKYYNVVPKEIKEIYKNSMHENFLEKRKKFQDFIKFARAAANLYGVIKIKDFIDIFKHYDLKTVSDYETVEKTLDALSVRGEPFMILEDYLINSLIYDSDDSDDSDNSDSAFEYIADLQKDKPRYLPEKEEFLKYENADYYEETPEVKAFKEYLKKNGLKNAEQLEEIFIDMNWNIRNGLNKPLDFMKVLNETGFKSKSLNMSKKTIEFAIQMYNNTRMWINNGYSASETGDLMQ